MFMAKTSEIKQKHLLTRFKYSDDRTFNKQNFWCQLLWRKCIIRSTI